MSQFLSLKQDFYALFYATAKHQNPQETFADFIKTTAIALHNAPAFCKTREDTYFSIIKKYSDNDVQNFCHMLSYLALMLEKKPFDALGEMYTELGLTNGKTGQFFTLHIFTNRGHLILRSVDSDFYQAWTPIFIEAWTLFGMGKILI